MVDPDSRRFVVTRLRDDFNVSERLACAVAGQHRSNQRRSKSALDDAEVVFGNDSVRSPAATQGGLGERPTASAVVKTWWSTRALGGLTPTALVTSHYWLGPNPRGSGLQSHPKAWALRASMPKDLMALSTFLLRTMNYYQNSSAHREAHLTAGEEEKNDFLQVRTQAMG